MATRVYAGLGPYAHELHQDGDFMGVLDDIAFKTAFTDLEYQRLFTHAWFP
jgi:hypothetical protein